MGSGVAGVVAQGVLKSQFGLPKVTAGGVHHTKVVLYFVLMLMCKENIALWLVFILIGLMLGFVIGYGVGLFIDKIDKRMKNGGR